MKEENKKGHGSYMKYAGAGILAAAWILAAWTGFALGVVPYSPGGEDDALLPGLTRAELGVLHTWLSVIAVFITALEIILTRKFLTEGLRHLAAAESRQAGDA